MSFPVKEDTSLVVEGTSDLAANAVVVEMDPSVPNDTHQEGLGRRGGWSTGLCGCFDLCCCSTLWWMSFCLQGILLGQIMQRMKLTWYACPAGPNSNYTCFVIATAVVVVYTLAYIFDRPGIVFALGLFFVYLGTVTRGVIRRKYYIEADVCPDCDGVCEDCCSVFCCGCCSIIQMARQTHNEKRFPYYPLSATGLASYAPQIEV